MPLHQAHVQLPSSTRTSIALWKWFSAPFDAMRIAVQVRYDARTTRGNSSKGVWTLFILVIMNYWGNTQGETANAKNQWGDADKLGNTRAAVYTCAVSPSPQQGMLLHLPPLRAGCLHLWPHYGLWPIRQVQLSASPERKPSAHSLRLACNTHAEEVEKEFKSIGQRYNSTLKG